MSNGLNLVEARKILERAISNHVVCMLHGGPGVGKSDVVKQIADDFNLWIIDERLAQMEPTDLRGIPVPNRETKCVEWYQPDTLPKRKPDGKCVDGPGILFFDEMEKATIAVKNAALQIVLDRKIGNYLLPDDVAIVCAGNREEDGCFSTPLGGALSNRMIHVEVEHDVDVWVKWARKNDIADDIIGFIQFKPTLLYDNTGHNAFPSPRSWAMASSMLNGVKDEKMMKRLITASVGEGVALEFVTWANIYREVDCEAVVTKGKIPDMDDKNPAFKYAVTMAVATYARKKGVGKYKDNILKFLEKINGDLRVVFFRQQTKQAMMKFSDDAKFINIVKDIMDSFDI